MKFVILGAGSGLPRVDFNLSSLVVQMNGCNLLVDCGEGTAKQLLKHGYNKNYIDAVLISHYHPDHVSGIFMLLQMLYLEGRNKQLDVFLPERISDLKDAIHLFYVFEGKFPFKVVYHDMKELSCLYPAAKAHNTDHLLGYRDFIEYKKYANQLSSYSFSFCESSKVLVYTSDITTLNNIEKIVDEASVLVIDAMHPSLEEIQKIQTSDNKRVILTHGLSDKLSKWLRENPVNPYEIAQEDVVYTL